MENLLYLCSAVPIVELRNQNVYAYMSRRIMVIDRVLPQEQLIKLGNGGYRYPQKFNVVVRYCGYLEIDTDPFKTDLWDLCNWSCWSGGRRPKECKHLLIDHCNSDVSFLIDGTWYSHDWTNGEPFSSFKECYAEMTIPSHGTKHFSSLWPRDISKAELVTEENIEEFVKRMNEGK